MLTLKVAKPEDMPIDTLAESFRDWFGRDPWLELYRCPVHNDKLNFGSTGRFDTPGVCPECGSELLPYWSDQRTADYFQDASSRPDFQLYLGMDEAGRARVWVWGYAHSEVSQLAKLPGNGSYVDHIGVDPTYSGDDAFKIFWEAHRQCVIRGTEFFVTRTHRKADYVKEAMRYFGYEFYELCESEDDREYWIRPNTEGIPL